MANYAQSPDHKVPGFIMSGGLTGMPTRPCLDCGRLTQRSRCADCQRIYERNRPQRPTNLTRNWAERQRRAAVVLNWVQVYGPVCPGWRREPHQVRPESLTADHVDAVARGGAPDGPLAVLCRHCNGAKSATPTVGG